MAYQVKEIFYTLQGEGTHVGRPAVFCRFAGCNLWNGRQSGRSKAACSFCDTDFVGTDGPGGGYYRTATQLVDAITAAWSGQVSTRARPFVVCTGGEPLLQLDSTLIELLHVVGFEVAIETNGTRPAPAGIDWICLSPKGITDLVITSGNELKLVFPQPEAPPSRFENLDFAHLLLQPMDGPALAAHTELAVDYCLRHPQWRLSLQTHKFIGIP
ncbi:7-carboxy-7-deazaguanine synthase [Mycobacteroides abscessus]